jgi:multidrug efflux pump subunit AcrB
MGAIMCMGVATSNTILAVSFATESLMDESDPVSAALGTASRAFALYG